MLIPNSGSWTRVVGDIAKQINTRKELEEKYAQSIALEPWKVRADGSPGTYWSGLEAKVYLADIYLADAVQVSYNVIENVKPYYHYSYYIPTVIKHGTRVVSGELTIVFQNASFMRAVLEYLRTGEFGGISSTKNLRQLEEQIHTTANIPTATADDIEILDDLVDTSLTIQDLNSMTPEQISGLRGLQDPEDRPGPLENPSLIGVTRVIGTFRSYFETIPTGVQLSIVFGGHLANGRILERNPANGNFFIRSAVPSGDPNAAPLITGIALHGVSILSESVSIADDGRPIMVTFQFLAKDASPMDFRVVRSVDPDNPEDI